MKKSLENQLTMCDMLPNGPCQMDIVVDQDVRRKCSSYKICEKPEKLDDHDGLYSFVQWQEYNRDLLTRSIQGHRQSNEVEYNVKRAINTLSASTDKSMLDTTKRISNSTMNIDKWKVDMFQSLRNIRNEIDLLLLGKKKIQIAQKALGVICSISTECLERRSFRLEMDLILDPGQIELVKENKLINEIGELMCRTLCQINDQINSNKRIKYRLEENWSNKDQVFKIDTLNLGLNIQSPTIMPDVEAVKNSENACALSPSEWEASNKSLHDDAQQIFNDSVNLRNYVDEHVLNSSAKQLRDQADAVDITLARFISDTQRISQAIENDLEHVVQRLGDAENVIEDLLRVINNIEKAKMTAETRLHNRLKRPEDDNCKDSAQLSLIPEVNNLNEQLKTLNYQLQCARTGHLGLIEVRSQLEHEARIKRKTLWIDCIRCQRVRAHYPSQTVLIGHY
ncbi:Hypothetical protein CINCED_3A002448 [Cinara cedri]|uniref:Tektin n=1 Tax=Cinara cedri TaxID=506608 RepID=A0A5E4MH91_9HEMI|nr:Hypothetical protein CINCED_3A002448 [Cinara cedri]